MYGWGAGGGGAERSALLGGLVWCRARQKAWRDPDESSEIDDSSDEGDDSSDNDY